MTSKPAHRTGRAILALVFAAAITALATAAPIPERPAILDGATPAAGSPDAALRDLRGSFVATMAATRDTPKFAFTPYTTRPRCVEGCTSEAILAHLERADVEACELVVGIRIDQTGAVTATDLLRSSGVTACDQAMRSWARATLWTPAEREGEAVAAWVAQPVNVAGSDEAARQKADPEAR